MYEIIKYIPYGRATTYGAIARAAGYPNMCRMVGKIIGENAEKGKGLPFHRVVNSQGVLSGRHAFNPPGKMQEILESEGIKIVSNKITGWKNVFWDPLKELSEED